MNEFILLISIQGIAAFIYYWADDISVEVNNLFYRYFFIIFTSMSYLGISYILQINIIFYQIPWYFINNQKDSGYQGYITFNSVTPT